MAKPLTDHERQAITDLLTANPDLACNEIARRTGRSPDTISRIARQIGHRFGRTSVARAREARSAYSAERRALLAARATERAEELLGAMGEPYTAFSFGGRDNVYSEHVLDVPPVEVRRQIAQAVRDLVRTVLDIDRHDNRADAGNADVDRWLVHVMGIAADG